MGLTLNQVLNRLKTIAESHKQLNSYDHGDIVDFLAGGDVNYPACFSTLNPSVISREQKQTTFNFTIWLCDLINVAADSKSNEQEVLSDLTSIAQDIISLLFNPSYTNPDNADLAWNIGEVSPVTYYTEKFEDLVGAAAFDISISVRFASDRCQVPINT